MNIGVDLRSLQSPFRTGVGVYTFELLSAILKEDKINNYYLFSNSFGSKNNLPNFQGPNVFNAAFHFPNKLFSLAERFLGWPKIDQLIIKKFNLKKLDYFFSPNLNFTSLSPSTHHLITIHDLTFELFPNYLTFRQRAWHKLINAKIQCQNAAQIFAPSKNTGRDLIEKYYLPENKIKIIYPGLSESLNQTTESPNLNGRYNIPKNYFLYLGTLEPRKNLSSLIIAFENVFEKLDGKYDLVIAGAPGWKNKKLIKQIQTSPLKKNIHLIGYVPESDKPILYKNAALFIFPSFYEGFGLPVLEAMKIGVPVITSNRSSLPEITSGSAFLVNPHRPAQISTAIFQIMTSTTLKNNLIKNGKNRSNMFNWESAAKEWLEALNTLKT